MARKGCADRHPEEPLTRGERRAQRRDAARQRMPQHGKTLGLVVGNALLRRAETSRRRAAPPRKPR